MFQLCYGYIWCHPWESNPYCTDFKSVDSTYWPTVTWLTIFQSASFTNYYTERLAGNRETPFGGQCGNRTHLISCVQDRQTPRAFPSPLLVVEVGIEPTLSALSAQCLTIRLHYNIGSKGRIRTDIPVLPRHVSWPS